MDDYYKTTFDVTESIRQVAKDNGLNFYSSKAFKGRTESSCGFLK